MSEEHDLKKSELIVGQLLPVIKDAHGNIVDGLHRKKTDPEWKEETWENIVTEEDYWKARAHLNYSRRNAQEARQEKIQIINNLAEYYEKQGLNVSGLKRSDGHGAPINEVLNAVIKALDGAISESWIRQNIDPKYTQEQKPREPIPHYKEEIPAIEVLERDKHTVTARYGEGFVDRLKKEMKDQIIEEISKPEIISPQIESVLKRQELREVGRELGRDFRDALIQLDEQVKKTPQKQEFLKNILGLKVILKQLESEELFCPKHQGTFGSSILIWDCCGDSIEDSIKFLEEQN